jgi:GTP pyrophosphokinase
MRGKSVSFEQLYDIRAVRVIVANIRECYTVLGVVHDLWVPVEGEFDDYIAQPKANEYKSLHTAVVGPEGKTLEVQIRTEEMHQHSEHGVAAHWRYKEGSRADKAFDSKIAWLRQVLAWKKEVLEGEPNADASRRDLFEDTIYVLTPQGRVVDLPAGSTPVDFAYHVHTDLGHRCRGAKVDGQMVPLNYKLQNAQRVEIMAAKQGGPSRDWLSPQAGYLASSRGLAKVRQWFRHEDFAKDAAEGRGALDKELQRLGATGESHEKIAHASGFAKLEDFYAALGRGEVTARQVEIAVRGEAPFAAEIEVVAVDRQGLLRDISEAISRERINVTAVNTLSRGAHAFMRFTLQVSSADAIQRVLRQVKDVPGVDTARRL